SLLDKPDVEVNRHGSLRVIFSAVGRTQSAVDVIADFVFINLYHQCSPASVIGHYGGVDVVRQPRVGLIGLPGGEEHGGFALAPATVGEILKVDLAVIRVHGKIYRCDGVKGFNDLITVSA